MKRGALMAVAVAGAVGSSVSSADTFLCRTPSDMSYTVCAQVASELRPLMDDRMTGAPLVDPSVVTYHAVEPRPAVVYRAAEPVTLAPAVQVPEQPALTITTYEYSGKWPDTEPSISRYHYSYGPWYYFYER